jgi:hypothetical protein
LKIKLKRRHFDRIQVIEAESQAVSNTLTEHEFQEALKNVRSPGNDAYARKGTTSWVMVASRYKVNFDQMVATVPEFMDCYLYLLTKAEYKLTTFA